MITRAHPLRTLVAFMPAFALALVVASQIACAPQADFDVGDSRISLSAVDPTLVPSTKLFVFSFSTTRTCADLMDLDPAAIGAEVEAERAPLQPLEPGGDAVEHVFGNVAPNVPIAFFVLSSSTSRGDLGQRIDFADLNGSVFAMACKDFNAPSGTRSDLPMTLFPVGLR